MHTLKQIFRVIVLLIAIAGMILSVAGLYFAWAYNTPATETIIQVIGAAEQVLEAADTGLATVNSGLTRALGAVNTIDGATRSVGELINETDLAFAVLERTVGETLFPRIESAQETVSALAQTIIGVNDALEAANKLPFVDLPTLTTELEAVSARLAEARARVEEIQANIQAIKEDKVARSVSFVTDRTEPLLEQLGGALATVTDAQARITAALTRLDTLARRVPRLIDIISITATLVMIWLFAVQGYLALRLIEILSGKKIDWARLTRRDEKTPAPAEAPSTDESV